MKDVSSKFSALSERLYTGKEVAVDDKGRIVLMIGKCGLMFKKSKLWLEATTENIPEISDLEGYRNDFHNLFGFGFDGVDYKAEANGKCRKYKLNSIDYSTKCTLIFKYKKHFIIRVHYFYNISLFYLILFLIKTARKICFL
jgi:hypothetical protein